MNEPQINLLKIIQAIVLPQDQNQQFYHPHVATVRLSISQTMIKWGFFYLNYPKYSLIFLVIENFRSILEAQAWINLGKS